ncbi:MAG: hypothetical protein ACON4R_04790 [Akkermansiaceae bacterium]
MRAVEPLSIVGLARFRSSQAVGEVWWITIFYPVCFRHSSFTKTPGRNAAIAGVADVVSTILDLCGVPVPDNLDGRCLKPLLSGEARWKEDRHLIVRCPRNRERKKWHNSSAKTQRLRLVDGDKLYDLTGTFAENKKTWGTYFAYLPKVD